jgi:outer membrane murein-binding lipoprotein Lpp
MSISFSCRVCRATDPQLFRASNKSLCITCKSCEDKVMRGTAKQEDPRIQEYCRNKRFEITMLEQYIIKRSESKSVPKVTHVDISEIVENRVGDMYIKIINQVNEGVTSMISNSLKLLEEKIDERVEGLSSYVSDTNNKVDELDDKTVVLDGNVNSFKISLESLSNPLVNEQSTKVSNEVQTEFVNIRSDLRSLTDSITRKGERLSNNSSRVDELMDENSQLKISLSQLITDNANLLSTVNQIIKDNCANKIKDDASIDRLTVAVTSLITRVEELESDRNVEDN